MDPQALIFDAAQNKWLAFNAPLEIISTRNLAELHDSLRYIENLVNIKGVWAAGFISYEAAPAFDRALSTHTNPDFPALWFGIYQHPTAVKLPLGVSSTNQQLLDWKPSISQDDYNSAIARIKKFIAAGDTYQVNFTLRLRARLPEEFQPWDYFRVLIESQPVGYGAFIDTGDYAICSASPELFFNLEGSTITTRPMKGTVRRGRNFIEDAELAEWLLNSEKNRAENVMIVDMMRNDLGKIARLGSVAVPNLFKLERYPTVWQMVSDVAAETNASISDIITALFPAASVTGAPKPRTMQIITELENSPRHIYTGSIGFLAPGRRAQFNVAIRTVLIDKIRNSAEYGVGGGIVWDSQAHEEYNECLTKTKVLANRPSEFALLETMRWSPDTGYFLLDKHLSRLTDSAQYFDFAISIDAIRAELDLLASSLSGNQRIRLLVSKTGAILLEHQPLLESKADDPVRLCLAESPVDSTDVFLHHKTSNRTIYDHALAQAGDCDDVILWNQSGEVTETCIYNLIVETSDGRLLTPPVSCGLLAGTYRALLIEQGRITEQVVTLADLKSAVSISVINSVRGIRPAVLCAALAPTSPLT